MRLDAEQKLLLIKSVLDGYDDYTDDSTRVQDIRDILNEKFTE